MNILINPDVHQEVMYYVMNRDIEVSGLGRVKIHSDGTVEVVKCYLLKQSGTGASTDLDGNAVAELMFTSRLDEGELWWWWHSHPTFNVFMSGTDDATIKKLGANGRFFATVFNQKGEMYSAYYQGAHNGYPELYVKPIETSIGHHVNDLVKDEWKANLEAKVKVKTYKYPAPNMNRWKWDDDFDDYDFSWPKEWKKSKRQKANKRKKDKNQNFLPNIENAKSKYAPASESDYHNLLDSYIKTPTLYTRWLEAYSYHADKEIAEITSRELWNFYETYDGDIDEVELHLVNEQADDSLLGGL